MRLTLRILLVWASLFFVGIILPAGASAVEIPDSGEQDLSKLNEKLSSDPTLKNWSSYSAAERAQIERGIAWENFIANLETGESQASMEAGLDSSMRSAADSIISGFENMLANGTSSLVDTGSTTGAIGGEIADEAVAGGLAAPLALIPIGALLAYQDITTGENSVYTALFSGKEDHEQLEAEGGIPAEAVRWQLFPYLGGLKTGKWTFKECPVGVGSLEGCIEDFLELTNPNVCCGNGEPGSNNGALERAGMSGIRTSTGFGGESPHIDPRRLFYLEPKVEGLWGLGAEAERCTLGWGCGGSHNAIPGYPPGSKVATEVLTFPENSPICCGNVYNATGVRAPSRMHMGLPHHLTKAEIEALEGGGHTINHLSGTPQTVKTMTGPMLKGSKEGGWRKHEKANKHWYEGGPEGKEPSGTPLPGTATVPSCSGSGEACKTEMEGAGFTNVVLDPLTWEHAVITKPAKAYIESNPHAGAVVETSTEIKIVMNPGAMPLIVPDFAFGSEIYTDYLKKLEEAGLTDVEHIVRTEIDPLVGPNVITEVSPAPETRVDPSAGPTTKIAVVTNPADAPVLEPGPKIGPPTLPGFQLPNLGVLCRGFPFGVPCWLWETIESWSAPGVAPEWGLEGIEIAGHKITGLKFQLAKLEPIMEKVRPAMVVFATIGIVLLFFSFAKGGGPPSGGQSDTSAPPSMPEPDRDIYL